MISINNLSVEFVGKKLFDNVTFKVDKGNKIALVGKNGAGKSTLLKIIAGKNDSSAGNVIKVGEVNIGFLEQDLDFEDGYTVLEEANKAFKNINYIKERIDSINAQLLERDDYESQHYLELINDLHLLNDKLHLLGVNQTQGEVEKILIGLGFKREDFDKQTNIFSGGWRMRIELAKLLLSKPELLLLDEPTNHLDIESILWLEKFLKNHNGAIVLVSHDKMFVDQVCNRTIEISLGKIFDYKANYSKYLELREERYQKQIQAKLNQDKEVKHTEELIEKFRYKASKAAFAQTLIKKLEKLDRIEVEGFDDKKMSLKFVVGRPSGKIVYKTENLSKSYDDNLIFSGLDLTVERGDKIAFVGQNGQGKTTLARILKGDLKFDGKLDLGHNIDVGYFAQNQAKIFDENKSVLEVLEHEANEDSRTKVRDILGAFMFSGEDADKKVKVLSGGERGRLSLARLLLNPHNVLILDEPTNHLDIASKQVLKDALKSFDGTLILVSHDRDFLQGLSNKVLEFRDGKIKEYLGDVNSYLDQKQVDDMRMLELGSEKNNIEKNNKISESKLSREAEKNVKRIKNQINNIEKEISKLENTIAEYDQILASEDGYDKIISRDGNFEKYEGLKLKVDQLLHEWEDLELEIENFK